MFHKTTRTAARAPWNKDKLMGQKAPLSMHNIWSIRMKLQNEARLRDFALFNLVLDSKLRACDLLNLRLSDVSSADSINKRATVLQQKTGRPVRFEITRKARESIAAWAERAGLSGGDYLLPSRNRASHHLSTRQYSRIVSAWVAKIGLDPTAYGTHSTRRTKNLRSKQLLLGYSKLHSKERDLGIEVDGALECEKTANTNEYILGGDDKKTDGPDLEVPPASNRNQIAVRLAAALRIHSQAQILPVARKA